jgi:hypothetical protein
MHEHLASSQGPKRRIEPKPRTQDAKKSPTPLVGHSFDEIKQVIEQQLLRKSHMFEAKRLKTVKGRETYIQEVNRDPSSSATRFFYCYFRVQHNFKKFWAEQCECGSSKALASVIVLTGSAIDAQATTVEEYMKQNWPDTGSAVLRALQGFVEDGSAVSEGILTLPRGLLCSETPLLSVGY